jgi:hypothetical protein
VVDGGPVSSLEFGTAEEARRKVDGGRLLVVVHAKAAGEVENLIGLHDADRARELRHFGIRVRRGTGRLSGGHTNDKVKGDNEVRHKRGKDVSDIKVEVNDERDTLTTRQLGDILATNRHKLVRRN